MSAPVFVETSHALGLVSVVIAFRSGSAFDPEGKDGLARITARMLRRGAEGFPAQVIEETIDSLGGEFAADASVSATSVHFEVIRRSLGPCSDLIARMLAKPVFDPAELARLLREAEAELIEARDSDRSLVARAFRKTLFGGHPYGRRVAGTIPTLRSITPADVRAFYEKHYCRSNAMVAVSGDIEPDEARALVDKLLSGLPEGTAAADIVAAPNPIRGRTLVFVDKPDRTQTQMVVGGLGTHAHDADHIPLLVANMVFGGTFTSRLMQEIRVKRGWSYGAYSRVGFDRQRDAFSMWAAPAAADSAACLKLELDLLSVFRNEGVTEAELEFVKRYIVRSHAFEVDTARKRVHQPLSELLLDLPAGYHQHYLANVQATTVEAANTAVRERLSEKDLVVGVVGTYGVVGESIQNAIADLADVKVLPFDFE